jgi:SAM-dependent methyltransferase
MGCDDTRLRRESFDPRLLEHREVWRRKPSLRLIYADYYRRLLAACPSGPLLDVGGGSGHVKEFVPQSVSVDILPFPGLDAVCDAHRLPFAGAQFAGVIMLDVLHHLGRPLEFLSEAARVLRPGGILAMIEPGMSPVAYPFYRWLHQEPADLGADPFAENSVAGARDPFDSNQAIPTLLFDRADNVRMLARRVPQLELRSVDWLSLLAYPLSGGFQRWCLVPRRLVPRLIGWEDRMPHGVRALCGFRLMIVLERRP